MDWILGWFGYAKSDSWTVIGMKRRWPWMGRFSPGGRTPVFTGPRFETPAQARAWRKQRIKTGAKYAFRVLTLQQEHELLLKLGYPHKARDVERDTEKILKRKV